MAYTRDMESKIWRKKPGEKTFQNSFHFYFVDEITNLRISIRFLQLKQGVVTPVWSYISMICHTKGPLRQLLIKFIISPNQPIKK